MRYHCGPCLSVSDTGDVGGEEVEAVAVTLSRARSQCSVVLDSDRGSLRSSKGVDAQQGGQGAVMDGDGLGDLQEAISST
jgi:hypothetical protein